VPPFNPILQFANPFSRRPLRGVIIPFLFVFCTHCGIIPTHAYSGVPLKKTILIARICIICLVLSMIAVGCVLKYIPVHCGVAGDVTFGPDMLKTTLGGKEGYFSMGTEDNRQPYQTRFIPQWTKDRHEKERS